MKNTIWIAISFSMLSAAAAADQATLPAKTNGQSQEKSEQTIDDLIKSIISTPPDFVEGKPCFPYRE